MSSGENAAGSGRSMGAIACCHERKTKKTKPINVNSPAAIASRPPSRPVLKVLIRPHIPVDEALCNANIWLGQARIRSGAQARNNWTIVSLIPWYHSTRPHSRLSGFRAMSFDLTRRSRSSFLANRFCGIVVLGDRAAALLVIRRQFLLRVALGLIVVNPELCMFLREDCGDLIHGPERGLLAPIIARHVAMLEAGLEVRDVATQNHNSGFRKPHQQRLMAGSVSGSGEQHEASVAEDVVVTID